MSSDGEDLLAGLYGLVLREHGYAAAEAAALVIERYPGTRSRLEKLARPPVADPLDAEARHLALALGQHEATDALGGVEEVGLVLPGACGVGRDSER